MAGLQKVLLVEDNIELLNLYKTFFTYNHFDVQTAVDGDQALVVAKQFQPDIIFLDIMMPKKDGFEVLKILRHDPTYNCTNTRIVILTNLGDATKVGAQVRADMDGYVVKAEIELKDLLEIIKSFQK